MPDPIAALLAELDALRQMQTVIEDRQDQTNAFAWQCVAVAIRDRREALIRRVAYLQQQTLCAASDVPAALPADVPPGRVH